MIHLPRVNPRFRILFCSILCLGLLNLHAEAQEDFGSELPRIPAVEPNKALSTFAIRPGFKLIPSATEPLVSDPVSMVYDSTGRAYVVEMRGYPYPEKKPTGKVRLIEDTNHDGVFDKGSDFITGLDWPTSVVPYKNGVFIAAPPEILYARDDNGDGLAETRKVMFSGFGTQNVQALLNGLLWGTDGWIYGSAGGNGGDIKNHTTGKVVSVRGRDFRFKPDGSAFEAISGGGQFGHSMDDWGHRFVCNNSNHIRQIMMPSHYLERNPNLFQNSVLLDIPEEGPAGPVFRTSQAEPWRVVRTRQRASDPDFRKRAPATELVATGFFTSATGVTVYRGTSYPENYRNNVFIGDVGGNLIHRKTLTKTGTHYLAKRADAGVEFLTSTDNWFRPVNFTNTPHGTLMILDMYRETIEHPFSIPEPIKKHLDLTSGNNRGRLYHLVHDGFTPRSKPNLETAPSKDLVPILADPDSWWRETAQRLILERADTSTTPDLEKLATTSTSALARAHALWTLAALGQLKPALLLPAFTHENPGLREQAARLSEPFLKTSPELAFALVKLADDKDGFVQLQTAFSLGELPGEPAIDALCRLASGDTWIKAAILTSLNGRELAFLNSLLPKSSLAESDKANWAEQIAILIASRGDKTSLEGLLKSAFAPDHQELIANPVLNGLSVGADRTGKNLNSILPEELKPLLQNRIGAALATMKANSASPTKRLSALRLARLSPAEDFADACDSMLARQNSFAIQMAAVQALSSLNSPNAKVAERLIAHWSDLGPTQRREVIEALVTRPERITALLSAIEAGTIAPTELDIARREQLLQSKNSQVADRSKAVFAALPSVSRDQVLKSFAPALKLSGNITQGENVYKKACATCHKAGKANVGAEVGPNLVTVIARSPADLLGHILEPNREVAPQYVNYSVAMKDGRILTGLIASESTNSLVLKRAEGVTETLARSQVEEVRSTGQSIMPEGLEQGLKPQDFADLIAFIRQIGSN